MSVESIKMLENLNQNPTLVQSLLYANHSALLAKAPTDFITVEECNQARLNEIANRPTQNFWFDMGANLRKFYRNIQHKLNLGHYSKVKTTPITINPTIRREIIAEARPTHNLDSSLNPLYQKAATPPTLETLPKIESWQKPQSPCPTQEQGSECENQTHEQQSNEQQNAVAKVTVAECTKVMLEETAKNSQRIDYNYGNNHALRNFLYSVENNIEILCGIAPGPCHFDASNATQAKDATDKIQQCSDATIQFDETYNAVKNAEQKHKKCLKKLGLTEFQIDAVTKLDACSYGPDFRKPLDVAGVFDRTIEFLYGFRGGREKNATDDNYFNCLKRKKGACKTEFEALQELAYQTLKDQLRQEEACKK